ncbi:restriction endonuclease subunit S [Ectopseudomonas mendocina]|uniref:Restriction endonuclease subunit S n=1 Tax=Ectopseudomonas mendocina TaxID=300 RepID=A0ABD7RPX7_ECTME|nr:restriction endonuclease subunit S [Pseudomonas mendocina]TRO07269.1 restriction endonuclease subunit S [Pseudomonas mendocina]TRO10496.1 restriction endonuclease subunit S [Pseudomonas mendocina]
MSWPIVNLGEISERVDYGLTASAVEKADGPRFLRITDMQDDTVDWDSVPSCECSVREYEENKLAVGDIVFARTGATTGKSYLVRDLKSSAVFASYLIRVRPSQKVDSIYLSHFFKSPMYWHQITSMANGAAQPGVNSSKLKELEIPLPPLPEQKRIAAILDKADAIRRKRQQAIQLADDFLRAVFLDMFGDPVTNPKGWPVKSLKDVSTKIGSGSTPRGGSEAYLEQGISLIRSLNIHDDEFRLKNLACIDDEQAEKLSNVVVQNEDVLLNITGASVCRCAVVPAAVLPARVNQHVCIIRPSGLIHSSYLLHLLISAPYKQKLLKMSGAGATREALTKQQVELLEIPLPPKDLQAKFEGIKAKVKNLASSSESFKEESVFESLSDKAFSGQL